MSNEDGIAADGEQFLIHENHGEWLVSWHPPVGVPEGIRHGAEGICVTESGDTVVISRDGKTWELPAGRPEGDESWEQTLQREVSEEACSVVVEARLPGFTRGECVKGHQTGAVLVRSRWLADVQLLPWEPRFEITHRRVVPLAQLRVELQVAASPFAPLIRRALSEANIL